MFNSWYKHGVGRNWFKNLEYSLWITLTVILTSHFSNITYFRQQQQQKKPMEYYEILPTHTETPRNATRKIANIYIEFNYHFLTLQKKIPFLLNRSVHVPPGGLWLLCYEVYI